MNISDSLSNLSAIVQEAPNNQWITRGLVIAMVGFVSVKVYDTFKVPQELKRVPKLSVVNLVRSILRGESFDQRFNSVMAPVLREGGGCCLTWSSGRWTLLISDPEQVRFVLNDSESFPKRNPDERSLNLLSTKLLGQSNIVASDGDVWRRHRKVANPAFKKSWPLDVFFKCTEELMETIESYQGQPVMIHELFQRLTLDALGRGIFSYDFQAMRSGHQSYHLKLYHEVMKGLFDPIYFIFPALESILPSRRVCHRKGQEFRQFLGDIVQQRKRELSEGSDNHNDLLSLLIKASQAVGEKEDGQQLSDEEVINDLATFFVAGHDTTANTLSSMFFYLARNPEIQERARDEVYSVLGKSSELKMPTNDQLKELNYIECVIKETMRILTTVSQMRRYCTQRTELPNGLVVPGGTYLLTQNWALHHDPKLFPDPQTFNPDRFKVPRSDQDNHWMAFGSGSRMCVGKNFSLIEQRVALVLLLQKYRFELGPKSKLRKQPEIISSGLLHPINLDIIFSPLIN